MRDQAKEISAGAKRFLDERGSEAEYRVVGSGSAAHGLDDVAEAVGASMIVVGSERHGARRRISPGSTGDRLLHGAICPVAVAPRGYRERPPDTPVKRIGVAFLDTPEAHEAVRFAGKLAAETGAGLTLYTVVAPRAEIFAPIIGRDAEEAFMATVREDVRAALDEGAARAARRGRRGRGAARGQRRRRARGARRARDRPARLRLARLRPGAPRPARRRPAPAHPPRRLSGRRRSARRRDGGPVRTPTRLRRATTMPAGRHARARPRCSPAPARPRLRCPAGRHRLR